MPGQIRKCAVPSCVKNNRTLKKYGVTLRYFSFPKDEVVRNQWLSSCNKRIDEIEKQDTICSRHFVVDDYKDAIESKILNSKPKRLKTDAVPSLFLEERPQELVKGNSNEYHMILAQEILNEEKKEASKSSEPPIYLEFTEYKDVPHQTEFTEFKDLPHQSKCRKAKKDIDLAQQLDKDGDLDPLEGLEVFTNIDIKEELIIKPYVDIEYVEKNSGDNCTESDYIGLCYVCDRKMRKRDNGQFSREDFTKIAQKVLEDISPDYMIVMADGDVLCCVCCDLVARISRLENELRTASLSLRALLRLKYSLPPPHQEKTPVEHTKEQKKLQKLSSIANSSTLESVARTIKSFNKCQQHKSTQVAPLAVTQRHRLTQTEPLFQKISKPKIKIVGSLNEVVGLEAGNSEETIVNHSHIQTSCSVQTSALNKGNNCLFEDIGDASELTVLKKTQTEPPFQKKSNPKVKTIRVVSSLKEVESLEAGDLEEMMENHSDRKITRSVQTSALNEGNNCLFEDISDASELTTLLNDDYLVEESVVVTENKRQAGNFEESKLHLKKSKKPQINFGLLKCGRCSFKTRWIDQMKTHMLSFINKCEFYCAICDYAYHSKQRLKRHKMWHSESSKNKRCIFCDKIVHDELHMRFHIEASHRKNSFTHKCSMCNRVFMFQNLLRKHLRHKHKTGDIFKCEKCDKEYTDKLKYDNHSEYYHRDSTCCKYCQRPCGSLQKLIYHENQQHRFENKQHYQCSHCPKRFIRKDVLLLHEKHHSGVFEYRCSLCNYGFYEEKSLEKHKRACKILMRTAEKDPLTNASTKNWLQSQLLLVGQHNRKRYIEPYTAHKSLVCDVCGKIITTRQKYKIHREMHDNPSSFQCHLCGKKFRYKNNMREHIKTIHNREEEAK